MLKHLNQRLLIVEGQTRGKTAEKWGKMAKNSENGGQNGLWDDKGGPREGRDRTAGPTAGGAAGHAGGPAGFLVVGPAFRFSEAVSAFLWEKDS